ncbi:hypothetical protein Tco_1026051 [Tanacetum coccineum]
MNIQFEPTQTIPLENDNNPLSLAYTTLKRLDLDPINISLPASPQQLLYDFLDPPEYLEIYDIVSDAKPVDIPLVSLFLDSDDELDDDENIDHDLINISLPASPQQLLYDFLDPPEYLEIYDIVSDAKPVDIPLVSLFLDPDDELDDDENFCLEQQLDDLRKFFDLSKLQKCIFKL